MFSYESKFYQVSSFIYKMVVGSLLVLLISIPIVTLPTALSAFFEVLRSPGHTGLLTTFFKAAKKSILKTLPFGVFNLLSVISVLQLIHGFYSFPLLNRVLVMLVGAFIIMYNIILYVVYTPSRSQAIMTVFRNSFFVTVMNFHKLVMAGAGLIFLWVCSYQFIRGATLMVFPGFILYAIKIITENTIKIIPD